MSIATMFDQIGNGLNGIKNNVTGYLSNAYNTVPKATTLNPKPTSVAQNVGQVTGFLGNVLNNTKTGSNQIATPYGYTQPNQVANTYASAGNNAPADVSKLYGTQASPVQGNMTPIMKDMSNLSGYLQNNPKTSTPSTASNAPLGSTDRTNQLLGGNYFNTSTGSPVSPASNNNSSTTPAPSSQGVSVADSVQAKTPTQIAADTGQNVPKYDSSGNYASSPTSSNSGYQTPIDTSSTATSASFPGIVSGLVSASSQPSADYTNIQKQIAQNLAQQTALTQDYAQKDKNIQGTAGFLTQANGEEGLLNRQYGLGQQALSNQYQGLSSQLGASNTQQQLEQTGLGTAAGLAGQQISPGNAFVDVANNGKEIYSGIGGLTGLGIAQQNIKQGQGYAQQSSDLGTALQGINTVSGLADNFLKNSGLNQSSSPFFNKQQNTTLGQLKAGDIGTYNELVNQIQTYANQIFASTGMTPTDAGDLAKSISIDGMTAGDLQGFLNNLDVLGQARKKILDTAANNSYASGTTPYMGATNSGGSLQTTSSGAPVIPKDPNATLQAIAGGVANFGGDAIALGGTILGYLGIKK